MRIWYGNEATLIVHADDCEYAASMHPMNLVVFDGLEHALELDYSECGWCIRGGRLMTGKVAVLRRAGKR